LLRRGHGALDLRVEQGRAHVVYPFTALTFVLVFLAGIVFFGERVSYAQWGGVAMILGGLYLIAMVR